MKEVKIQKKLGDQIIQKLNLSYRFLFLGLNALDTILTIIGVEVVELTEGNILANWLGFYPFLCVKLCIAILLTILLKSRKSFKILNWGLAGICINNLVWIIVDLIIKFIVNFDRLDMFFKR